MRGHVNGADFPVLRGTVTIRSPRSVLLLQPFEFFITLGLWVTCIVFTFWPAALEHAPVSFEQRGVVHHVWHYALLFGTALILVGMFWAGARRLLIEQAGLFLTIACLGLNLTAVVAEAIESRELPISGLTFGVLVGFTLGMIVRVLILIFKPTVSLPARAGSE